MRTLLLADDNVTTQRLITLSFAEDSSFRVVTVVDGQQAIDYVKLHQPDIVLAATTVPQVNGYDLAKFFRGRPSTRQLPVLLLCGAFEAVEEARVKSSGANGVVEKPLDPASLVKRVKELLSGPAPAPVAAMVTRAEAPPTPPAAAPTTAPAPRNRQDYLDTLGAAFDSLDQRLDGRIETPATAASGPAPPRRAASPPVGPASGAEDENPIFEVDLDWFANDDRRRVEKHREHQRTNPGASPEPPPADTASSPVYEVDDDWFLEDRRARAERHVEQQQLAAEMGIHDVELPEVEPAPNAPAPAEGLDFDFGLDDLPVPGGLPPRGPDPDSPFASPPAGPASGEPGESSRSPILFSPPAPPHNRRVSDDFVALLAQEQLGHENAATTSPSTGESEARVVGTAPPVRPVPEPPAQPQARHPDLDEAALSAIAAQVAQRLATGPLADRISEAITAAVRATVRTTVSDASERLVRDEIARIKEEVARKTRHE